MANFVMTWVAEGKKNGAFGQLDKSLPRFNLLPQNKTLNDPSDQGLSLG